MLDRENANLNFDIAPVPQGSGATTIRDYGDFYAFAIPKASQNRPGALAVALILSQPQNAKDIADAYDFAPAQRSLYDGKNSDPVKSVIYQAALIAHGWLDPSPKKSDAVFQDMVEGITSGKARTKNVIIDSIQQLEALF